MLRLVLAIAFAGVFVVGAAGNWYEPSHEWLMPLSVVGVGAAIGNWHALWLALLGSITIYLAEDPNGDPPPDVIIYVALMGAVLLGFGVLLSKIAEDLARSKRQTSSKWGESQP